MAFLPLVQRELRTAARRKTMFRVRWWTALLAIAVGFVSLGFVAVTRARGGIGNPLFNILTGYALGLCLLSGVVLTADSLSEEKREGTLGLLFLTNLKSCDVMLGKFIPSLLIGTYVLLALLPITAIPLLLGGVTGGEFWRVALALLNAMFISLAAGELVSSTCTDSQRAMGNTLVLILILAGGLPGLAFLCSKTHLAEWCLSFRWLSPSFPYSYAAESLYVRHAGEYWGALVLSNLLGWGLLGSASVALGGFWKERSSGFLIGETIRKRVQKMSLVFSRRKRWRDETLTRMPVLWLLRRRIGGQWSAWAVVIVWAIVVIVTTSSMQTTPGSWFMLHYTVMPFGFLLKLLFALQASKFLSESRRDGTLELLLCTPLTDREIIRGQVSALWRGFGWPVAIFLAVLFAPLGVQLVLAIWTKNFEPVFGVFGGSFLAGITSVRMVVDLLAVCWFGMGLAVSMRKPQFAPAMTIVIVLILPAILSSCFLDLVPDIFFIFWGMSRTRRDLRHLLIEQYEVAGKAFANKGVV
jgi:ABC-type transport system involved in multi-copper enzyme maturation permease subunit